MALGAFVAGRYSANFNSVDLGISREGYRLTFNEKAQQINRSDAFGQTLIETIQQGGDWALQSDSLEYKAGPLSAMTLFQGTLGLLGQIGVLGSATGESLVMTVTALTAAALNGSAINTLTASLAILAPNANISLTFDSTLREFPIRFQLLPSLISSVVKHFSTS